MKKIIPAIIAIALIIIILAVAGGSTLFSKFSYSNEHRDLKDYYNLTAENEVAIVLQDEILDIKGRLAEGQVYLSYKDICSLLTDRFYVDENDGLLIYAMADGLRINRIGEKGYYPSASVSFTGAGGDGVPVYEIDGEFTDTTYPVTLEKDGQLYIALEYVKDFADFSYELFTGPNRIQLRTEWGSKKVVTVKKDSAVRYQGGVKSDILREVKDGEELTVLEELEEWDKVKTSDALIGYIEKKHVSGIKDESEQAVTTRIADEYTRIQKNYKINMAWHAIYATSGNDTFDDAVNGTGTMSIIAPTWFSISSNDGTYRSFASASYVNKAHERNMEVWAVLDNFNAGEISTYEVMSYLGKRQILIKNLMSEITDYGIDGINLDFELVPSEAVPHYVEFIRELSIECRRAGIVLSVDNYPPQGGNDYNLKEQGICADYVVIMSYDEHWGSGGVAGSVASIGFVEQAIQMVLSDVSADKIINGIPFYTRVWKSKGGDVTSEALGMGQAKDFIAKYDVSTVWDEETCQNYGEKEMNGTLYQIWLEDEESIGTKLNIMKKYGVAGVAEWQLGMEDKAIWSTIDTFVKN
ncbi:MAG: chitinase [Lachnospiraceae bacterium]|nr:chitinase [Lachnospiraceae bacterium]